MAMDPAIVFMFSVCFLSNFQMGWRRNLLQVVAAVLAVAGTVFFAIEGNDNFSETILSEGIIGVLLACGSVLLSSSNGCDFFIKIADFFCF